MGVVATHLDGHCSSLGVHVHRLQRQVALILSCQINGGEQLPKGLLVAVVHARNLHFLHLNGGILVKGDADALVERQHQLCLGSQDTAC